MRRRPKRIVLVRHGESEGNIDKTLYAREPDSLIGLTATGFEQGVACGRRLRSLLGRRGTCHFYYSPYMRTRQTLRGILRAFRGRDVLISCEPRLRECDFGNFQDAPSMEAIFAERQRFGRFYFRFPNGEAVTDVFDRVHAFWQDKFMQQAMQPLVASGGRRRPWADDVVLVTHGLLMRTFCMSYFGWTPSEFEQVWNPSNGEMWLLERSRDGEYELAGRLDFEEDGAAATDADATADGADAGALRLAPIRFGVNQSEALPEHMKRPAACRWMAPVAPGITGSPLFANLHVPGPRTQAEMSRSRVTE